MLHALDADWQQERELTARVATLAALGLSAGQITEQLDVAPVTVRDAMTRLQRIAPSLLREEAQ